MDKGASGAEDEVALDGNPSCVEKDRRDLEVEAMDGSSGDDFPDDVHQGNTSSQDEDLVDDEMDYGQVVYNEGRQSLHMEENLEGGSCDTEFEFPVVDGNPNSGVQASDCHASKQDEQKMSREDVQRSTNTKEWLVERIKIDAITGEVSISRIESSDGPDGNQCSDAKAISGSAGSLPNGDLILDEKNYIQDTKEEVINQATGNVTNQVDGDGIIDINPLEENPSKGACTTVTSSSGVETSDVCQTTGTCGNLDIEDAPDSGNWGLVDEKEETVAALSGILPRQLDAIEKLDPVVAEENLDEKTLVTKDSEDSDKVAEANDLFPATGPCVEQHTVGNFDSARVTETQASQDGFGNETDLAVSGPSTLTNASQVEHVKVVRQIASMDREECPNMTNEASEAEVVVGSAEPTEDTSMTAGRQETDAQVAEMVYNVAGVVRMDTHSISEKLGEADCAAVDSCSVSDFPDESQCAGAFASSNSKDDRRFAFVTDSVSPFVDVNPNSRIHTTESNQEAVTFATMADEMNAQSFGKQFNEGSSLTEMCNASQGKGTYESLNFVSRSDFTAGIGGLSESRDQGSEVHVAEGRAAENEEWKSRPVVVEAGRSMVINEVLIDQIQVVGEELAAVDTDEVLRTNDDALETAILDRNPSCKEQSQSFETEETGGNSGPCQEENTFLQDGEQGTAAQETEMIFQQLGRDEMSDSYPITDGSNRADSVNTSIISKVVNVAQATVTEDRMDLEVKSEFLHHDKQNIATHVSETVGSPSQVSHQAKVELGTESAGGFSKPDGTQTTSSNKFQVAVYEFSGDEYIMGNLDGDLGNGSGMEGNQSTRDDVVMEAVSPVDESRGNGPDNIKMEGDVDFSLLDPLDDDLIDDARKADLDENQKVEAGDHFTGFSYPDSIDQHAVNDVASKPESTLERDFFANYCLAPEKEGEFSPSDLVWGKVRSHPWWPGQIFDSADSSEQAMKYQKKDCYLVAYFGDQTFAWNEASSMKHFRTHFAHMEKQSSAEAFRAAINGALEEVSRRVGLGMACSCIPGEAYAKIESQIIDNAGIREGARKRDGVDEPLNINSFEPDNFLEYIKALALYPCGGGDKVELVIAQTQLVAFSRLKGYKLPEFHVYRGLSESDLDSSLSGERKPSEVVVEHATLEEVVEHATLEEVVEHATLASVNEEQASSVEVRLESQDDSSHKRKHDTEDDLQPSKKEKNVSELTAEEKISSTHGNFDNNHDDEKVSVNAALSSTKKHELVDSFMDDSMVKSRKHRLSPSRDTHPEPSTPQPFKVTDPEPSTPQSFKVGDCIRRIASQLSGAPTILKSRVERPQESAVKVDRISDKLDGAGCSSQTYEVYGRRVVIPNEYSYPDEMLSQLCLAAIDPMKVCSFLTIIVDFFTDFRNSITLDSKFEKMGFGKSSNSKTGFAETFDFEDTNDSYWTDRIVQLQNTSDEQPPAENCKGTTLIEKDSTSLRPPSDSHQDVLMNKSPCMSRKRKGESWIGSDNPLGKDKEPKSSLQLISPDAKRQNVDSAQMQKTTRKPRRRRGEWPEPPTQKDAHNLQNLHVNHERKNEPTALVLSFPEGGIVPSEVNLNKIFSRFGPLRISETEVVKENNSAKVVFKRRSDAEVALSSSATFNIFGPAPVSYQLMDVPPMPPKSSHCGTTQGGIDIAFIDGSTT